MRLRPRTTAVVVAAVTVVALAPGASASRPAAVHAAARALPGPAILRAPPADAPQLQNRPGSGWRAGPLLVSGAQAYVRGEFLSQGYLYDDHGGAGVVDSSDQLLSKFTFAAKTGTLTYPTDKVFANNAADLVEFRVRADRSATALRVTVNSLVDPARTAFTVALGSSPAPVAWPAQAGVSSPAAWFLTVHGATAELTAAVTGKALVPAPSVRVDRVRRQYDVRIPSAAWDPGSSRVRMAAGVGLWDVGAGHYLTPGPAATTTAPGGASPSGAALFDLAF